MSTNNLLESSCGVTSLLKYVVDSINKNYKRNNNLDLWKEFDRVKNENKLHLIGLKDIQEMNLMIMLMNLQGRSRKESYLYMSFKFIICLQT